MRLLDFPQYRAMHGRQSGTFLSAYASHGGDFHEIRAYEPGDNIARIDWAKTLSRWGDPLVRSYRDEVDRSIHILVDTSPTLRFSDDQSSQIDCLCKAIYLLIRSAWVRQMSGVVRFVASGTLHTLSIPTNEANLQKLLTNIREAILANERTDTRLLAQSVVHLAVTDALVFVIGDRVDFPSANTFSRIQWNNLIYRVIVRHPLSARLSESYTFTASNGDTTSEIWIDPWCIAAWEKYPESASAWVQMILLDSSEDVFLPFVHAFTHPLWKA